MALIECPECGREVSDKALACPHCGNPIAPAERPPVVDRAVAKVAKGLGVLLIILIIIFGLLGGGP